MKDDRVAINTHRERRLSLWKVNDVLEMGDFTACVTTTVLHRTHGLR